MLAQDPNSTEARTALAQLCEDYWYPLYAYVRRCGHSPEDAKDMVQEFFARLLALGWLSQADHSKGRFRSFLLGALKHFLANEWDRARALKRGGSLQVISLDAMSAETRYRFEPAHQNAPDKIYERRWALTLLERVLAKLREEHAAQSKLHVFDELKSCLTGSRESLPYAEIATKLKATEGSVKVMVHRFRQRYRELLRQEAAQTLSNPAEVESELKHLAEVLRG